MADPGSAVTSRHRHRRIPTRLNFDRKDALLGSSSLRMAIVESAGIEGAADSGGSADFARKDRYLASDLRAVQGPYDRGLGADRIGQIGFPVRRLLEGLYCG